MEKKVIDFARSESNSSFDTDSPGAAKGDADDADGYESDEYVAFKDHLRSGVDFRPVPPLRSSLSLASSFPPKSSSGVTGRRSDTGRKGDRASYAAVIVSMIDRKMKGHVGHLLRAAHVISAQINQLENRSNQLEGLIDNLKDSTEFYYKKTERRLREVEDMMTEVQDGIQDLRDKQKIAEVQLQLAMVQQIRVDLQSKQPNRNIQNKLVQQQVSYGHSQNQHPHPSPAACQQKLSDLPSYGPPSFPQNPLQMPADTARVIPQQLGHSQSNFVQQYQTCTRQLLPTLDSATQQHPVIPAQSSVTLYRPHMHSSCLESSQLPHPQTTYSTLHTCVNQVNRQAPERPYMPSEYPRLPTPELSSATGKTSLHQQFNVDSTQRINNQSLGSSMATRGHSKQPGNMNVSDYGARSSPHYGGSTTGSSQVLPPFSPAPRVLPRALPVALDVNEASSSGGTESSVSIEEIVENAVAMGFRRNAVKAAVGKLTENEQSVDLNLVLDKLIHSGEPR
ncbi:uncharacterized protein LOC129307714 isoform X2 [Prosopis cineraria]|uniref:uncharacterized protein LOC129307714 isoform X2 n=1 Tax=Prosopis cineraria TaxID=364024 RepID=UPI0024107EEC|nr:uncharacterized protein LOC129307714 isoform X2 [Prosopis cineraria]